MKSDVVGKLHRAKMASSSIRLSGMQFSYEEQNPLFFDFNLDVAQGSRCLLVGANGSGNISFSLTPILT